ncbi:MAG: hypothetical protein KJO38_07290, partial [Gammaproteobacteria bacterium]|nr:hypothetical protein [Gammaproteobacteria bacterium]
MSIRLMLFTALLAVPVAGHPAISAAAPASNASPILPVSFEENRGQGDPHFHFLARMRGHTAAVAPGELWLRFPPDGRDPEQIVLRVLGADDAAPVQGIGRLQGRSNYFRAGREPVSAGQFRGLRYRELLPGIDWLVYARGAELEHDYVVAPGVEAAAIEFAIEGAQATHIDSHGQLQIDAGRHTVALLAPVLYQELDGRRVTVPGAFERRAGNRYGFRVGAYDRSRELVIDPVNRYATYLGGTGQDEAFDIAVDADGNAYV